MPIIGDNQIINQFAVNRDVLRKITKKYCITKRQFEVLSVAYSLQSRLRPYFFTPDIIKRLDNVEDYMVYKDVIALKNVAMVNLERKTSAFNANFHCVSGTGLNVLKSYTNQVRHLVEVYSR